MKNHHFTIINKATWAQEYLGKPFSLSTVPFWIQKCNMRLYHRRRKPYNQLYAGTLPSSLDTSSSQTDRKTVDMCSVVSWVPVSVWKKMSVSTHLKKRRTVICKRCKKNVFYGTGVHWCPWMTCYDMIHVGRRKSLAAVAAALCSTQKTCFASKIWR